MEFYLSQPHKLLTNHPQNRCSKISG